MNYQELVATLSPEMLRRFRRAVETGQWPDGTPVSSEQREHCLQAIIAWEQSRLPEEERVGYIAKGAKGERATAGAETPLRWADNDGVTEE